MTKRELIFGLSGFATFIIMCFIIGYVSIQRYEKEAIVNAQIEIEKTKIQEEAALKRTKERMNYLPWYKGGSVEESNNR